MQPELICYALNIAIKNKRPNKDLIVHSNKGDEYYRNKYYEIMNWLD